MNGRTGWGLAPRPAAKPGPAVVSVDRARCVHCGLCTGVCGGGALRLDRASWELVFLPERCNGCGRCLETCPLGAIADGPS